MTIQLQLPSDTETRLRERAAAAGQDMESFVLQAVQDRLAASEVRVQPSGMHESGEWAAELDAWIASHPVVSHYVDDDRDSIYSGRGE